MPIPFTCPHCGHQTLVDDKFAGQSGACAKCQQTVGIPEAASQGGIPPDPRATISAGATTGLVLGCAVLLFSMCLLSWLISWWAIRF